MPVAEVKFNGTEILTLYSMQDWIKRVPRDLPKKQPGDQYVWVDKMHNVLTTGKDFKAAADLDTYPIIVYKVNLVHQVKILESKK